MSNNDRSDREHMGAANPTEDQPRWAQDFPIDVGRDNYVARRDFTKFMVLTSFAFVVGQLWIGFQNYRRRRKGKPAIKLIAQMDQLPVGSSFPFNYPDEHDPCLLIRRGESELLAFSQKCTHLSCAVLPDVQGNQFLCPCHEGCFEMTTGRPIAGPPRRPLEKITLSVRGNTIYATGVEESTA
jgi:Rieske Fe-S protein